MAENIATSVASSILSKLWEYLIAPIGRQFGYVLCFKRYVENLKNGVKELGTKREWVQHSVNEALYDGKSLVTGVTDWLKRVDKKAEEAENLLRDGETAKNGCFRGWLPNPFVRHPIGRKVKKMTQVIKGLLEESTNDIFQKVGYENSPRGIVPVTRSTARIADKKEDVLESRASMAEVVIDAIADDKVSVIGVFGPGGVGKSKLLKDVERRLKEDPKIFDAITMANVSCNQDIRKIQAEIAEALGLHLKTKETICGRAERLRKRIEAGPQKHILIILDNLWEKLELEEVGIPCADNNKVRGCKLLLTSRNRGVLHDDMGSDRDIPLYVLEHEEARRLFEMTVGDRVNDPDFEPWVDGVVENCGGLPLLIVSLAKRLKDRDLAMWRNASTSRDLSKVKPLVEVNYKDLKEERTKSLFLICSLTSGRISMGELIPYSMGLGLFKEVSITIENVRDGLSTDRHVLLDSSLLLDSDDVEQFQMHDIFVDAAISIASTEWNALVGRKGYGFKDWSKDELRKCTAMSFPHVGIDKLPEKLECPNLRMLLLFEHNPSLKIPNSFFESMEKLQVLVFAGLYFTTLPSSIEFLENLRSLCLDFCHLEDVTGLGKLKGLQFLSFFEAAIARLPKEIGELTELRFLDLSGCNKLKVIEPGVLGSLVNLEELHLADSFDQWEFEDEAPRSNACLAELNNMNKLSTLSIAIPHSANLSIDLPVGKLNRHKIQIGDIWDWSGEYKESRTLKVKLDSGNLLVEDWMQRCLEKTEDLHLDGLEGGNDSIHDLCFESFQELKHLHVKNSSSFRYVVHSTDDVQCTAFAKLESLFVENLNNLKKICHGCLAPESFSKLKTLKVDKCDEILHLFPLSKMKILSQLEEIEISSCHLMQQIITDNEADEIVDDTIVKLSNLLRLTLHNLPKMTSFFKITSKSIIFFDGQQVSLPRLESLTVSELPKLEDIWNSQYPPDVTNLKYLKVEGCTSLSSIIPSSLLIKLVNLEVVTVERCQLIREVFDLEGLTIDGDVEILSQLTTLTLSHLPNLGCIWNKNPRRSLCHQNLRALKVHMCENLRFLFSSSMVKALAQIKEIEIASCVLMEEIMYVQQEESEEAATFDTLEFPMLTSLSLVELPNLRAFTYGKCCIQCSSLTKLRITGCPQMMTFSSFEGTQQSMTADTSVLEAFGRVNSSFSLPGFFNEKVLFPSLEELKLSFMCQLKRIWHNQLHEQSFCKLASLTIEFCENLSHVFPSNLMDRLQSLNKIEVVGCPSLEALFEPARISSEKRQNSLILCALEKMKLLNLPRLRDILKSDCKVALKFPSLMEVNVRRCNSLSYLFSSATAKTLDKLATLDVSCCDNLRGIIAVEEGKGKSIETLKFHQLSTLKLGDLDKFISFRSGSCAGDGLHPLFDEKLAFPKLEELQVQGVQQEELWNDKILVESFCRLKALKVKQCHNLRNVILSSVWDRLLRCMKSLTIEKCSRLRNLFTMSMAESLGQLQYLCLRDCGEMEHIVAREEGKPEEAVDRIIISQIVTLYLHNMPKLKSFYQGKHVSEWPSLKEFTVEDCKAMKVIIGNADRTELEESVPMPVSLLLLEKVEFPNIESMKISRMDNMDNIWPDEIASNAFSKLKTLVVEHCEKLSSIMSSFTMFQRFQNLEKIIVTDCGSLEVVFHAQEFDLSKANSTSTFQLRELVLKRLPKMKHVWSGLSQGYLIFGHFERMEVWGCESLESLFPSPVAKNMTRLEELIVQSCGVEEIIMEEDGAETSAGGIFFPQLADLRLLELPKLRSFHKNSHTSTWPSLKQLFVRHCGKMRSFSYACGIQSCQGNMMSENLPTVFPFKKVMPKLKGVTLTREDIVMLQQQQQNYTFGHLRELALTCYHDESDTFPSDFLLHRFPILEELVVMCSSFKEIFPEDAYRYGGAIVPSGGLTDVQKPFTSPGNLKRLLLQKLGNLRRVWKEGSLMIELLDQIELLLVWECPRLSIILPSPTSFQKLTRLHVEDCDGLVHVGTYSAMTSLVHLIWLILRNCAAMEDVVTDHENGAEEISFPKLQFLRLDGLPRLESFSTAKSAFSFPSLEHILVQGCPKINIFCMGALTTPNVDRVFLSYEEDEWRWEGDLNTTIQTLST